MFSQPELRISYIDSATLLLPTVTFRGASPTNQSRGSWSQIIRLFPSSGVCCVLNVASAVKWPSCQLCCEALKIFLWLWARGVHNIFTLLCETDFAGNISPFTFIYLLIAPPFTGCLKTTSSRLCPLRCYKGSRHLSVVSDNTVTCKSCRTEKKNKVHPSSQNSVWPAAPKIMLNCPVTGEKEYIVPYL